MPYDYLVLAGIAASYLLVSFIMVLIALYLTILIESRTLGGRYDYCPDCGGTGFDKWWTPCQRCRMTGYVPNEANHR